MSDSLQPESPSVSIPASSLAELRLEVQQLRTLVGMTLIATLLITFSVGAYVYKQVSGLRRELKNQEATMAQIPEESRKMTAFIAEVKQFGRTYPDFADVLKKYNLKDDDGGSAPPAAKK